MQCISVFDDTQCTSQAFPSWGFQGKLVGDEFTWATFERNEGMPTNTNLICCLLGLL